MGGRKVVIDPEHRVVLIERQRRTSLPNASMPAARIPRMAIRRGS